MLEPDPTLEPSPYLEPESVLALVFHSSASANGSGTSLTWSHSVPAGADRLLVVTTAIKYEPDAITGVTWQGNQLTRHTGYGPALNRGAVAVWYMVDPPVATGNVVVSMSAGRQIIAGARSYSGADQTTPFGPMASVNSGATNSLNVNVTAATGDSVIDVSVWRAQTVETITPGAGQTEDYERAQFVTDGIRSASSREDGAAPYVTMSQTVSGTATWGALLGIAVKAAAEDTIPPGVPTSVTTAEPVQGTIRVTGTAPTDSDTAAMVIRYKAGTGQTFSGPTDGLEHTAEFPIAAGATSPPKDKDGFAASTDYTIGVAVRDVVGNWGDFTTGPITTMAAPPSAPDTPTALSHVGARSLQADVSVTAVAGHRILYRLGTGHSAPTGPTDAAWTLGQENELASGTRTVPITLPTNNDDYTIAAYAYNGSAYSASALMVEVFAAQPPAITNIARGWIAMRWLTTRAGWPVLDIHSTDTWAPGSADIRYDARLDGPAGWLVFSATADPSVAQDGQQLDPSGVGADQLNIYLRRDFAATATQRYARAYAALV